MSRLFFPPPSERNKCKVDLKLDLENYATKTEIKAITGVDTSLFAKKTDLDDTNSDIKEVKKDFVKNIDFDNKVNTLIHKNLDSGDVDKRIKDVEREVTAKIPDVSNFITKTEVDTKIDNKIPDVSNFVKKTELDAKIDNKINEKIPDVSNFVKKTELDAKINSKLPDVSDFVKKTELDAKIDNKIPDVSNFVKKTELDAKIKDAVTKSELGSYVEKTSYDVDKKKLEDSIKSKADSIIVNRNIAQISSNKVDKSELESEVKKLQTKIDNIKVKNLPDKIINEYKFNTGRKYFTGNDGFQNTLIYPPMLSTVERDVNDKVKKWVSTGREKTPLLSYNNFKPIVSDFAIHFQGNYLAHEKESDINDGVTNFYIVYKFDPWTPSFGNKYPFHNSLFGSVDDKFKGRGIAFDSYGTWTHDDGTTARNVFIFGTDNSSSSFSENRKVDFTCLGVGPVQYIENKSVTSEAKYGINFTKDSVKFVLSLHYNPDKSYIFVNGEEIHKFKALKISNAGTLALGVLSKSYADDEIKDVSLYGNVYEFSVDHRVRDREEIKNIHTYLMKKHDVK